MAYATEEEREKLKAAGWTRDDENMQFCKQDAAKGLWLYIGAAWVGQKVGDMTTPPPEAVHWIATLVSSTEGVSIVVDQRQQCQSPVTCMVLAEVREWKAQ